MIILPSAGHVYIARAEILEDSTCFDWLRAPVLPPVQAPAQGPCQRVDLTFIKGGG